MIIPIYLACALALLSALFLIIKILKKSPGDKHMQEISLAIQEGAVAFLTREYLVIGGFATALFAILAFFINLPTAISYLAGAILSGTAGFIGMKIATKANSRTTHAAATGLQQALTIAFSSGAVMGLSVVGLGLLGITILYTIFNSPTPLFGFSLGFY